MNIKTMENKVKVWLARDWNGALCVHCTEPSKDCRDWISYNHGNLENHYFPSVKWEDNEPTEAYITLAEPPTNEKNDIDWEQRRYEIAKDMMPAIYRQEVAVSYRGESIILKDIADIAIAFADTLIKELKEQSK